MNSKRIKLTEKQRTQGFGVFYIFWNEISFCGWNDRKQTGLIPVRMIGTFKQDLSLTFNRGDRLWQDLEWNLFVENIKGDRDISNTYFHALIGVEKDFIQECLWDDSDWFEASNVDYTYRKDKD